MKPIVLCGEAYGVNEVQTKTPFVGASGIELLRMLNDAGFLELTTEDYSFISKYYDKADPTFIDMIWRLHPEFHRTNVFAQHPPGNNIEAFCGGKSEGIPGFPALTKAKYVRKEFSHELERLADELVDLDPNLILALGNTPLWALCGITGISKVRGAVRLSTKTATGFKVLPTYHPAAVLRQWENRPVAVMDFMKAKREAEFPEIRRPKREIWIEPTLEDIKEFINRFILPADLTAVDIETAGNQITCIGFAPDPQHSIVIPFLDDRKKNKSYWPTKADEIAAWALVRSILTNPKIKKVFQNGLYDIAFIWRANAIPTYGATEDTMLKHHAMQPESLKGLGFLGSVYTDEGAWKTERRVATIKKDD